MQVFAAIVRHVDWDIVRCLVIAGPGFAKDEFREYLDKGGIRLDLLRNVWLQMVGLLERQGGPGVSKGRSFGFGRASSGRWCLLGACRCCATSFRPGGLLCCSCIHSQVPAACCRGAAARGTHPASQPLQNPAGPCLICLQALHQVNGCGAWASFRPLVWNLVLVRLEAGRQAQPWRASKGTEQLPFCVSCEL